MEPFSWQTRTERNPIKFPTNLEVFRRKVREYRRLIDQSQAALAGEVGLHSTVLSNKLNGTNKASLSHLEIKLIIKTLARWEAFSSQGQVLELLELMNLKSTAFTFQEWQTAPLDKLEQAEPDRTFKQVGIPPAKIGLPDRAKTQTPNEALPSRSVHVRPSHNLLIPATPLIGRERQLAQTNQLLKQPGIRLLTLTGAGGIGKTRLALQLALDLLADFRDGVFLVELATLTDPLQLAVIVAEAIGLEGGTFHRSQDLAVEVVLEYLRNKQLLLVLDNFEQVTAAAPVLKNWLSLAPDLKILITSRSVLHLYGEYEYEVPALDLPDLRKRPPAEQLATFGAIALFVQQARTVRPDFRLNEENAASVAEICVWLDGLPLAIELAAARLKLMTSQSLRQRLEKTPLQLLTGGPVSESERHQTLRKTLDWSYQTLDKNSRELFGRIAVFEGGFSLEGAEALVGPVALDGLTSLLDHSMLRRIAGSDGSERFSFLVVIREYALEKLEGDAQAEIIRGKHADYFLALAQEGEKSLAGPQQQPWLNRLEMEYPNLQAALRWLLQPSPVIAPDLNDQPHLSETSSQQVQRSQTALQLCCALGRFWLTHGYLSEGRFWLEKALETPNLESSSLRARALNYTGSLANFQGDYAQAKLFYEASLRLWQELADNLGVATVLNNLGNLAKEQSNYSQAQDLYSESLARQREAGNTTGIGLALNNLGNLALEQRDYPLAKNLYEESLSIKRKMGNKTGIAQTLNNLGNLAVLEGAYSAALSFYAECLQFHLDLGDKGGTSLAYYNLGEIALIQGDYTKAKTFLKKSLTLWWELNNRSGIPRCLEGLAGISIQEGHLERAASLLGMAEKLREVINTPLPPTEQERYEELVINLRAGLTGPGFNECWTKGKQTPLELAVTFALE